MVVELDAFSQNKEASDVNTDGDEEEEGDIVPILGQNYIQRRPSSQRKDKRA